MTDEEITANLNGLTAREIRLLAALAIGYARARDTQHAPGWRRAIVRAYERAKGLRAQKTAEAA